MSLENGGDLGRLDEDCLYLNVFSPRIERTDRLPVMVWVHGGALIFGSGGLPIYDGIVLARRDVVVVTINYRLGAFGFFVHKGLDQEAPGGRGYGMKLGLVYAVRPRLARYSMGLSGPKEILMRFS